MLMQTNAVGRLYQLLRAYQEESQKGGPIRDVWSRVLDVESREVALRLAVISAELLPAARQQIVDSEDSFHATIWGMHEADWFRPLLHDAVNLSSSVTELPAENLAYLAGIWSGLNAAGVVEGRVPDAEEVRSLVEDLTVIREDVENDDDMHPTVRDAMVRRLSDLIAAFTDLRRTGPSGVQAAASRILGDLSIVETLQREPNQTLRRLGILAYASYLAVAPLGDFVDSTALAGQAITAGIETVAGLIVERRVIELPEGSERPDAVTTGLEQP